MKKSLLALAVLGAFAGAASAQSSVTMYGSIDMSISKGNGSTTSSPGAPSGTAYKLGQSSGSRLGFRGSEDIGGGWSGQFHFEHRFTPDNGKASSDCTEFTTVGSGATATTTCTKASTDPFWQGRSFVQITNAAVGSVYMGREYDPAFWPAVKVEPFGWDGVGQNSSMQYAGYSTAINGASSIRTSNTGGFKSRSFGGLTVQVAVSLGEGNRLTTSPTGAGSSGRVVSGNVEYAGGPIYAAVGYSAISTGSNDGHKLANFGMTYDLGFIRPAVYFAQSKVGAGGTVSGRDFMFGLTAPVGPGKLKFAINSLDPNTANNTAATNSDGLTKIGVGYDYALSKRTNVYVDFGQSKSKAAGSTVNRAAAAGMKHTF